MNPETEIPLKKAPSYKGKINHYVCEKCAAIMVTVDRDEGTTPFITRCRECGGAAKSQMYRVNSDMPPTYEWRIPTESERAALDSHGKFHVDHGGLILFPIENWKDTLGQVPEVKARVVPKPTDGEVWLVFSSGEDEYRFPFSPSEAVKLASMIHKGAAYVNKNKPKGKKTDAI